MLNTMWEILPKDFIKEEQHAVSVNRKVDMKVSTPDKSKSFVVEVDSSQHYDLAYHKFRAPGSPEQALLKQLARDREVENICLSSGMLVLQVLH